jgi:hypothetical protein
LPGGAKIRKHKVSSKAEENELISMLSQEKDAYKNKDIYIFILDDLTNIGDIPVELTYTGGSLIKISFLPDIDQHSATKILEEYWGEYAKEMGALPIFMHHMTNSDITNFSGHIVLKDNSNHTYAIRMPPGNLHVCGNIVPEEKIFANQVIFCRP